MISARQHPELRAALHARLGRGELVAVLPGVYTTPEMASQPMIRVAAVPKWDPAAVLTHEAAAALSFWPEVPISLVRCVAAHQKTPQRGYQFTRGRLPAELVVERGELRFTSPALTALDLGESRGGEAIDHALRTRSTTLPLMRQALELTAGRSGNAVRWELFEDSRDEPWSEAERQLHRLLRAARITGWTANKPLLLRTGLTYPDVWFKALRLVLEVDGREFHSDGETFEADRWRQNHLMLEGYLVLRFTWRMVSDEPARVVEMVREAMALSVRLAPGRRGQS